MHSSVYAAQVKRIHGHVVAQIVEAEFVVGAVCDVALVGLAAFGRVWFGFVDAVHTRAVEHVQRAHPFGVSLGEIVVDSYHMHASLRQRSQEYRQCSHQCLAFAGCHFGNLALVQDDATDQLHIVVRHVPFYLVAACHPVVFPDSLVAFDGHEPVAGAGKFAVEISCGDCHGFVCCEAGGGLAHYGEYDGKVRVELVLEDVEYLLLVLVDFVPHGLAFVERQRFDILAQFVNLLLVVGCGLCYIGSYAIYLCAQLVEVHLRHLGHLLFYFVENRANGLEVAAALIAEDFLYDIAE